MQFLHPTFLYGLFLIAIPVIIHLFKLRRYRTVYFSNLKFLGEAQTSHKNKARLRDILLLLIRSLFIAALVLAFAQPVKTGNSMFLNQKDQAIGIYIDCSQSMKNQGINGKLLDQAKRLALETIQSYPLETSFLLIKEGSPSSLKIRLDRFEIEDSIRTLAYTNSPTSLNNLISQLESWSAESSEYSNSSIPIYIYSDFQNSFITPVDLPADSKFEILLQKIIPQNTNNIYIDTCWLSLPVHHLGARVHLTGRISNTGKQNYLQFPLSLTVNDSLMAQTTLFVADSSSNQFEISYLPSSTGWQKCELHINDYPVDFDNSFYFSFSLNKQVSICHLYDQESNNFIDAAFAHDSLFNYSSFPVGAYPNSDFSGYQTLIITDISSFEDIHLSKFEEFVANGGNLIFFPTNLEAKQELNKLNRIYGAPSLTDIIQRPEMVRFSSEMDNFFQEISLNQEAQMAWPQFFRYFRVSKPGLTTRTLLETQTGRPVLMQTKYKNGSFNLAAFALSEDFSILPEHPLFIPIMYYMSTAETRVPQLYSRIGARDPYPFRNQEQKARPIELFDPLSDFFVIPQQEGKADEQISHLFLNDWIGPSGFLQAGWQNDYQETLAMNYSQKESEMEFYSNFELEEIIKGYGLLYLNLQAPAQIFDENSSSKNNSITFTLAKILLMIALSMLIFESIIYRFKP